jgi:hypothetical protein
MAAKKYPCLVCKEILKRTDVSVPCCVCEEYTHPGCSEISDDLLKYLTDETRQGNSISWTCTSCNKVGKILNNKIKLMYKEFGDIKKDFEVMKKSHKELKDKVTKVEEKSENTKVECKQAVADSNIAVFAELREREERKHNIVVYGLQEGGEGMKGLERKKFDIDKMCKVAKEVGVSVKTGDIKFAKRLGQYDGEDRPLQVGLFNLTTKENLLKNGRQLKDSLEYGDIYISPDITKQQREEEKELWKEAERRNEVLEPDEALNSEWKVVGMKGEKRLILTPKVDLSQARGRGRAQRWVGVPRGRGAMRGRGMPRGGPGPRREGLGRGRGGRQPALLENVRRDGRKESVREEEEEGVAAEERMEEVENSTEED